eukprot:scaffold148766_cov36-Tisochrysis_lutea.AAC.1
MAPSSFDRFVLLRRRRVSARFGGSPVHCATCAFEQERQHYPPAQHRRAGHPARRLRAQSTTSSTRKTWAVPKAK